MFTSAVLSSVLLATAAIAAPAPAPAQEVHFLQWPDVKVAATAEVKAAAAEPQKASNTTVNTAQVAQVNAEPQRHQPAGASIDHLLPPIVPVNTRGGDADLITKLMTAPTQADRFRLLNQPGDFVFDFLNRGPTTPESHGNGGFSTSATSKTFPALIGNGAAMTLAFLGPCGMNTAHVHPRATELNVIVKGRLVTNFIMENGLPPIANTMNTYQMSVFPMGAIHQEFNPDCEDAVFVAGFNNVDPGVEQAAQTFFNLRPDVLTATLGGVQTLNGADFESFKEHIPDNIAQGIDACLNKCGIKRNAKRDLNEIFGAPQ